MENIAGPPTNRQVIAAGVRRGRDYLALKTLAALTPEEVALILAPVEDSTAVLAAKQGRDV